MGQSPNSTYPSSTFVRLTLHPSPLFVSPLFLCRPLPFFRRAAWPAVLYNSLLPRRTVCVISHRFPRLIAALPLVLVVVLLPPLVLVVDRPLVSVALPPVISHPACYYKLSFIFQVIK